MALHNQTTRRTLIARVKQGDSAAWQEFYDGYKDMVYRIARSSLNESDSEDLMQNVFAGLCGNNDQGKPRFRFEPGGPASFRTWFRRVIRNKRIDHFRKKRPERPAADTQFAGNDADSQRPPPDRQLVELDRERFEREFERHWRFDVLQKALKVLKAEVEPQTYEALILSKFEGYDVETVAQRFARSRNAIDQANHRCLRRLREIIVDLEKEQNGLSRPAPKRGTSRKPRKK